MDNHFTAKELANGCKLILASGVHTITDVEESDTIPENVLVHHTGGTYECTTDTRFRHVKPMTFKPLEW